MTTERNDRTVSNGRLWAGRIISGIFILFSLLDGISHILKPPQVIDAFTQLQIPIATSVWLGVLQVLFAALYLFRRTAFLAGVLFTGYLGGAVAIHLRAQLGVFFILFPVLVGIVLWTGLCLRYHRVETLLLGRHDG